MESEKRLTCSTPWLQNKSKYAVTGWASRHGDDPLGNFWLCIGMNQMFKFPAKVSRIKCIVSNRPPESGKKALKVKLLFDIDTDTQIVKATAVFATTIADLHARNDAGRRPSLWKGLFGLFSDLLKETFFSNPDVRYGETMTVWMRLDFKCGAKKTQTDEESTKEKTETALSDSMVAALA